MDPPPELVARLGLELPGQGFPEKLGLSACGDDRIDASPALAGNQLFLRGQKFLYCIADEESKSE